MARFQCGSVYYPKRSEVELQLDGALMERYLPVDDGESIRKPLIVRRSARHLNPLVTASRFNEGLWWNKNQLVIFHLDQGKKVPGGCRHCRKRTSADPNGPGTAP